MVQKSIQYPPRMPLASPCVHPPTPTSISPFLFLVITQYQLHFPFKIHWFSTYIPECTSMNTDMDMSMDDKTMSVNCMEYPLPVSLIGSSKSVLLLCYQCQLHLWNHYLLWGWQEHILHWYHSYSWADLISMSINLSFKFCDMWRSTSLGHFTVALDIICSCCVSSASHWDDSFLTLSL